MKKLSHRYKQSALFIVLTLSFFSNVITPAVASNPSPQIPIEKISVGMFHTCRVSYTGEAKCWGANDDGQSSPPQGIGEIVHISSGDYNSCAMSSLGLASCWGRNDKGQSSVPASIGLIKQIVAGDENSCAINNANLVKCWGDSSWGVTKIPKSLGTVKDVGTESGQACAVQTSGLVKCWGDLAADVPKTLGKVLSLSVSSVNCAITLTGAAKCWDLDGYIKLPADLGQVKSIDSTFDTDDYENFYDRICAVETSGIIKCWDSRNSNETYTVSSASGFSEVTLGKTHNCALQNDGRSACWGSYNFNGQLNSELDPGGNGVDAFQPAPSEPRLSKTADGIAITVTQLPTNFPNETITRTLVDVKTGVELCRSNSRSWTGCTIQLDHIDKDFRVASQSSNRFGSSPMIVSKPLRYCGLGQTRIESILSNESPVSGEFVTLTGNVLDSCESATQVFVRQRTSGKSWGTWKKYPLVSNSFQLTQKVVTGTDFQFKTISGSKIDAQGATRVLPSYADVGFIATGKSKRNSQGFNQGGYLTYNIYAPSFYNARCTMLGETTYAFNFALTHMGSETKYGYFNVKNGRGSGTLKMTWNGEVRARVLCESAAFSNSVTSERFVIFRANF